MGSLSDSVETVTSAATAIVSAESRVQPTSATRKHCRSWWTVYWCFGSQKNKKKVSHAVLVPESTQATPSNVIVMPFIAPPSSPAIQYGPPSATQSPTGLLSVVSLSGNAYSPNGPASIFAVGPYTYENQLVSPPVFSTFTTEPSTACFTPPLESVQMTASSSPEVPFAHLLTSSIERNGRNSGNNHKYAWSHYEHQQNPGSPGVQLRSPGSAISTSGTSTPFPDKRCILEAHMGEAQKVLGSEHFSSWKWGSRIYSGSLTPDGAGIGSRLGSGYLTPDCVGIISRPASGSLTPDSLGQDWRLISKCSTQSQESCVLENQIYKAPTLAHPQNECQTNLMTVDHRVSFELTGEDVARCLASKSMASYTNLSGFSQDVSAECNVEREGILEDRDNSCDSFSKETFIEIPVDNFAAGKKQSRRQYHSVTLGSIYEFNFDNTKVDASNELSHDLRWWVNNKVIREDARPGTSWSIFPMTQSEIS